MQVLVKDLRAALKAFVAPSRFACLTLSCSENRLSLTGRRGDVVLSLYIDANCTNFRPCSLPVDVLYKSVRQLPRNAFAFLTCDIDTLCLTAGSGASRRAIMIPVYQHLCDTPTIHGRDATFNAHDMRRIIDDVMFCIDPKHHRTALRGVQVELQANAAIFIATDAHCLVRLCLPNHTVQNEKSFTVPIDVLKILNKLSYDDIHLYFSGDEAFFFSERFVIKASTIKDSYPDTSFLFLPRSEFCVDIPREAVIIATRNAIARAGKDKARLEMHFNADVCNVIARSFNGEELIRDFIALPGTALHKVAFDARLLITLLERLQGRYVRMYFSADRPGVAHVRLRGDEEGYTAILMPLLSD